MGCFGGLSCFGSGKRGKRIVPASRIPDGKCVNIFLQTRRYLQRSNHQIVSCQYQPILLKDHHQPSFATGPYAHETHLVSPPVFSTFTTEPSATPTQWDASASACDSPCSWNGSSKLFGLNSATTRDFILFPIPASSILQTLNSFIWTRHDNHVLMLVGGLVFRGKQMFTPMVETDTNKTCKQDVEEIEAYRASFGFSADEIHDTKLCGELSEPLL